MYSEMSVDSKLVGLKSSLERVRGIDTIRASRIYEIARGLIYVMTGRTQYWGNECSSKWLADRQSYSEAKRIISFNKIISKHILFYIAHVEHNCENLRTCKSRFLDQNG